MENLLERKFGEECPDDPRGRLQVCTCTSSYDLSTVVNMKTHTQIAFRDIPDVRFRLSGCPAVLYYPVPDAWHRILPVGCFVVSVAALRLECSKIGLALNNL